MESITGSPKLKRNHDLGMENQKNNDEKSNTKNFINQNKNFNSLFLGQRNNKFINNFISTFETSTKSNYSNNSSKNLKPNNTNNTLNSTQSKPSGILEQKYENQKLYMQNRIKTDNIKFNEIKRSRSGSNDKFESTSKKQNLINSSVNLSEKLRIPKSKSNA